MTVPTTIRAEGAELTVALLAAVPSVEGLRVDPLSVEVYGAFTPAESAMLQAVVTAHNGDAVRAAKAAKALQRRQEHAKNPATLTLPERVRRLEILSNVD